MRDLKHVEKSAVTRGRAHSALADDAVGAVVVHGRVVVLVANVQLPWVVRADL